MFGDRPPVWASKTVIVFMLIGAVALTWLIITGGL